MPHILTRRYGTGKTRYTAVVRVRKGQVLLHRESKTFAHRSAAVSWARHREVSLEDPTALAREQQGAPTLAELIRWYIDSFETVSKWQRSKQTHMEFLERHAIGKANALQLTAAALVDHIRARRAAGAGPATVSNDLTWMGVVLRAAKSVQAIPVRPEVVEEARVACRDMPDTPDNQRLYPQPRTQADGLGFPIARIVSVICLSTGAVIDTAIGPYKGHGAGETTLARQLIESFSCGDIVLADALFCSYFWIAALQARGVDALFERHGSRHTDFRQGISLGARDHLIVWAKPERPAWMDHEQYASFPKQLQLRELKAQGHVLISTLCNARTMPKRELSALYRQRWNIELDLRNIKSTLQMEELSCHSAAMNEKEIWVHLLAYNLIRLLMAQAAANAGIRPRQLSFKHTVQLWTQWQWQPLRGCSAEHSQRLFRLIAAVRVGNRPGRIEPRMLKRRSKCFDLLREPRALARARVRKYGHVWV